MIETNETFYCVDCRKEHLTQNQGGTGYATIDYKGKSCKVCYVCVAYREMSDMIETGKATLYLVGTKQDWPIQSNWIPQEVTNWPNTLRFPLRYQTTGNHNIARIRYDVWFSGPDGFVWWGVTYGNNTQICHCKRTKEKSRP